MKELTSSELTELVFKAKPDHWELWRQNNTAIPGRKFIGRKGIGDITGYNTLTGQRIEIEVKKIGDVLTDNQAKFLIDVAASGGISGVATQSNKEDLFVFLVSATDTTIGIRGHLTSIQPKKI